MHNKWVSDLHRVREGKQDRSRKTQAALLDAAEELFAERGVGGATIADMSAAAGCSIGAFYHHYRDKQSVQFALFDRYASELTETTNRGLEIDRWQGASVADILQGYLQLTLLNDRTFPGRARAAAALSLADVEIGSQMLKLRTGRDIGLVQLMLTRSDEIGHNNPELAAAFVVEQLGSMIRVRLHGRLSPRGFGARSDDEFVREAMVSVCAYLQVELRSDF